MPLDPVLTRRALFAVPVALAAGVAIERTIARDGSGEDAGWPAWAPTRQALYATFTDLAAKGKDIRSFGAKLDGTADDTDAVEKAVAAGTRVLLIPAMPAGGALRLTRQIRLNAPIWILGAGDKSLMRWEGSEASAFLARPVADDPTKFAADFHIDSIRMVKPTTSDDIPVILQGVNVRGLSVTRCSTDKMGTLLVQHMRAALRQYGRKKGSPTEDPAVIAGFSATDTDDLNEDIFVYDNRIDAGSYLGHVARFAFTRRVAVVGNDGRFAKVSWWGGGAKVNQGGAPQFLRRVRDVYVTHNTLSGANGGVYGNNGDGIYVAHNKISDMTDVGVDFEGCFNAVAEFNEVRNVGNFCYVAFYAAKNIVFRNNFAMQDGSASTLAKRWGRGAYGAMEGRALFGLRGGGFARTPEAIDVQVLDNHFVWAGKAGTGRCIPSFFGRLRMERNQFENVECPMDYRGTQELHLVDNRLSFDRTAAAPLRMLAGGASHTFITGNEIRVTAQQPEGSSAIWDGAHDRGHEVTISGNRLIAPGSVKGPLPIVLRSSGATRGACKVSGNMADAIYASNPELVQASGNVGRSNQALQVAAMPAAYMPVDKPDASDASPDDAKRGTDQAPPDASPTDT